MHQMPINIYILVELISMYLFVDVYFAFIHYSFPLILCRVRSGAWS